MVSGEEIRRARQERRMTQDELAEVLDVTRKTVSNWERGIAVPRTRLGALVKLLRLDQPVESSGPTLAGASNLQLVQELERRLDRVERQGEDEESDD